MLGQAPYLAPWLPYVSPWSRAKPVSNLILWSQKRR